MSNLIYILNGPNLNLLGQREPEIYGHDTLKDVENNCFKLAKASGFDVKFLQSNHEGQLCDWIQEARLAGCAIIINPAGYTTTSIAILDSLLTCKMPIIEVHISNIHRREEFRHHSYISKAATGVIAGLGVEGYELAIRKVISLCNSLQHKPK